jgi:Dolichyl-phosphate-mannose-protein mannosyltransferase
MVEAQVRSRVAAIPTWVLVGGLFALSFVYRFVYAIRDPVPWIFQDELAYSELAKAFGETGAFAIRGVEGTGGFAVLYPLLIAPAYWLFDSIPDAYDALRVINCALMSSTVVPVYLIARRLVPRYLALLAAALSVALPSLTYTGTVMTENAFYPLVALWALTLIRALEHPTVLRQLLVFAVFGLAFLARVHAVVLLPVLVASVVIVVVLDALAARDAPFVRRLAASARPFWATGAVAVLGAASLFVRQAARGAGLHEVLGVYGGVAHFDYEVGEIAHWLLLHLAELDILFGVFGVAALIAVVPWSLRPSQPRELRIFGAVAITLVPTFVVVGAAYAADPAAARIMERNVFHVAPIVFVALVVWVGRGAPRPWWAVAPAALFAGTLTLALPLNDFFNDVAVHSTTGLVPLWRWRDRAFSPESIDEVVFLAAVLAALAFVLVPRRFAVVLPLLVLLFYVAGNRTVEGKTHSASVDSFKAGVGGAPRDWIDRAVGQDADVTSLWWTGSNAVPYWEGQFFNRSVNRALTLSGPYDGFYHAFTYIQVAQNGALLNRVTGDPLRADYVLTDEGTRLHGRLVAENERIGLVVYDIDGQLQANERLGGLYPDNWSGGGFGYERFACDPGVLRLSLENNRLVHPKPFTASLLVHGEEIRQLRFAPSLRRYTVSVPVQPRDQVCRVELQMPTGPAAAATPGDPRELGLRFRSVRYSPRR